MRNYSKLLNNINSIRSRTLRLKRVWDINPREIASKYLISIVLKSFVPIKSGYEYSVIILKVHQYDIHGSVAKLNL